VEVYVARLNKLRIPYKNARGVPQTITTRADGIKQIYFQDPDNYWIEINDDKY
jgi:lactoylglutathione lyase